MRSIRIFSFPIVAVLLGLFVSCIVASLFLVFNKKNLPVNRGVTGTIRRSKLPTAHLPNSFVEGRLLVPGRNLTVLLPDFVLGGPFSHAQFSVSIQARSTDSHLPNGCVYFFVVNISGSAVYSPVVTCKDGGVYTFEVDLVEPGSYNLKIRLGGSVGPIISADLCYSEGHNISFAGVGEQESIHFIFRPEELSASRSPKALLDNTAPSSYAASSVCSPEEFYHGRFVPELRNYSIGGLQKFDWRPFQRSASCNWPAFWGRELSVKCLEGKWIAFIGDSTLREIALDFVIDLYGSFNVSWESEDVALPGFENRTSQNLWDTLRSRPDLPRVTFMYIGHWDFKKRCGGVSSLWHRDVQARLKETFGDLSKPTPADVLIFNSGLHDVCGRSHKERFPAAFFSKFHRGIRFASKFGKRLIWKTTSPRLQRCMLYSGNFARGRWLDQQIVPMARELGFQIAEQYHLNIASQDGGDGMHCRMGLSCWTFASSLMNFICQ
mmetsp:Transcript_5998/g.10279  ORF Transcript_5998/g.10279 Transcript_5998/m.10279 type:complete len:493 (-) Transcript_5998:16-1494(-)